jgi:ribosomal-protein-alanine N-acetyltransferase
VSDLPTRLVAAGADAASALARLERRCLPDPWSEADLRLYLDSGAVAAWLLETPAGPPEAIGYAIFQLLPGECELLRLGIDPTFRRRGRGRDLLLGCLELLGASGRPLCHLEVRAGNAAARGLYETLDFAVVGERRGYYADGENAVRYRREARPESG